MVSFSLGSFLALEIVPEDRRVGALAEFFGGASYYRKKAASRMPPVLILHGDKDDSVPVARAYELEKIMQHLRTPYEIRIYAGEGHGFSAENRRDALDHSIGFFEKHLPSPKANFELDRLQ